MATTETIARKSLHKITEIKNTKDVLDYLGEELTEMLEEIGIKNTSIQIYFEDTTAYLEVRKGRDEAIIINPTSLNFAVDNSKPEKETESFEDHYESLKPLSDKCKKTKKISKKKRTCRVCGCTDDACYQCIEKTGKPCHWVEKDLCSACSKR